MSHNDLVCAVATGAPINPEDLTATNLDLLAMWAFFGDIDMAKQAIRFRQAHHIPPQSFASPTEEERDEIATRYGLCLVALQGLDPALEDGFRMGAVATMLLPTCQNLDLARILASGLQTQEARDTIQRLEIL